MVLETNIRSELANDYCGTSIVASSVAAGKKTQLQSISTSVFMTGLQ